MNLKVLNPLYKSLTTELGNLIFKFSILTYIFILMAIFIDFKSFMKNLYGMFKINAYHKANENIDKFSMGIKNKADFSDTTKSVYELAENCVKKKPALAMEILLNSETDEHGKEFSNWKAIGNQNDIDIYFADPGTPSQRALNEHSNGLLRRDGLVKAMDFNEVSESFIQAVASKRNHIPRKSLKYQTPMEIFLRNIKPDDLSNLI